MAAPPFTVPPEALAARDEAEAIAAAITDVLLNDLAGDC